MNRMKFVDEPNKFMESELELHAEIQELYAVAASPELYPVLVQAGAVNSILGCVTHENTDISIAAVGLLQEMTEVDTISDQLDDAEPFIEAFLAAQGLELIVQNLSRLDERNEEDAQGVQQTLNVIENLVELDAEIAVKVCKQTHILKFLLNRCKNKNFDANKLYSSEILSILLQADERNQVRTSSYSFLFSRLWRACSFGWASTCLLSVCSPCHYSSFCSCLSSHHFFDVLIVFAGVAGHAKRGGRHG